MDASMPALSAAHRAAIEEIAPPERARFDVRERRVYSHDTGVLPPLLRAFASRRRGENVSSWEVERVVNAHPSVLESAAVGSPSELGEEEEVRVFVVPRPGAVVDPLERTMTLVLGPRRVESPPARS